MFFKRRILQSPAWEAYTRTLCLEQGEGKGQTIQSAAFHSITLFSALCFSVLHSAHHLRAQSLSGSLSPETVLLVSYHPGQVGVGGRQVDHLTAAENGRDLRGPTPFCQFLKHFPYLYLLSNINLRGTVYYLFLSSTQDAILEADTEFWISVCCEFSVQHQIQSLMNILDYLMKLPEEKEGGR